MPWTLYISILRGLQKQNLSPSFFGPKLTRINLYKNVLQLQTFVPKFGNKKDKIMAKCKMLFVVIFDSQAYSWVQIFLTCGLTVS